MAVPLSRIFADNYTLTRAGYLCPIENQPSFAAGKNCLSINIFRRPFTHCSVDFESCAANHSQGTVVLRSARISALIWSFFTHKRRGSSYLAIRCAPHIYIYIYCSHAHRCEGICAIEVSMSVTEVLPSLCERKNGCAHTKRVWVVLVPRVGWRDKV